MELKEDGTLMAPKLRVLRSHSQRRFNDCYTEYSLGELCRPRLCINLLRLSDGKKFGNWLNQSFEKLLRNLGSD